MSQQSLTVAAIVVITFALGFATGRVSAPQAAAPVAVVPVAAAPAMPVAAGQTALPPDHPAIGGTPFPRLSGTPAAAAAEPTSDVAGTVAELIQVPNYTYLRISTGHGDEWAAVTANNQLSVGQKIALAHATKMESFPSKTLGRTFDTIWFGELAQ